MVAEGVIGRGVSIRQMARQLGVHEGALRYRLKRSQEAERPDGRSQKSTSLDGYEDAVHTALERLGDVRVTGETKGRPAQARQIYDVLVRDHGFTGSYKSVVRHLVRRYGRAPVRALRRVETPPGVQAQHDWFEVEARIQGENRRLPVMVGTLSHSRARFPWLSQSTDQLAWHTGHVEIFRRYGGVPLWVRIDNLKTGVASGSGGWAVLNRSYQVFARELGFEIDPCRSGMGQDKGKTERSVRTFRADFGDLLSQDWRDPGALQLAFDERAHTLLKRLRCPATGTSVEDALRAERLVLQPMQRIGELFDVVVSRRVSRDCLVSFEGRRYSVPFIWIGRDVEVLGTHSQVVIRAGREEIARHPRRTSALLVLDPAHFEGESTPQVLAPTPLGRRARLQLAGLSSSSRLMLEEMPAVSSIARPLSDYVRLLEVLA